MKVTFIVPYYHNIYESLGVGYIASYCRKNFDGELDFRFFHEYFDDVINIIASAVESDIVAFSCTTPTYQRGIMLASVIKKTNPSVHIVFGGWHVTTEPHISNGGCIDQIIIGEGEAGFLKVLNGNRDIRLLSNHRKFDDLPWPDRNLIRNERNLDLCYKMSGERIISFQSRRGCPFKCAMCAEYIMSTHNIRLRNVEDLLDEIEFMTDLYSADRFRFVDPTWCYPKKSAVEFCEEKIKRNFTMQWEAMGHAGFLDKELLSLMKRANCNQVNIGVESGSQKILNDIKKGLTVKKVRKVFEWGKELDLHMRAFFILGMPNEDEDSIRDTKSLIREIDPDIFGMTILCPYPGSSFYDYEKYKDIDWSQADEYDNDFWNTKNYSNSDLKRIQREFTDEFNDKLPWHQRYILEEKNG